MVTAPDDATAIKIADSMATLDKSGRTKWSEIRPINSVNVSLSSEDIPNESL